MLSENNSNRARMPSADLSFRQGDSLDASFNSCCPQYQCNDEIVDYSEPYTNLEVSNAYEHWYESCYMYLLTHRLE